MVDLSSEALRAAFAAHAFPTVTLWNRTESRPRAVEFGRALKAEVRDALWMLTRQWQLGELSAEDAGSPAVAILSAKATPLTTFRAPGGPARPLSASGAPLEMEIERRRIPFVLADQPIALDLRLAMGRRWLRMIEGVGSAHADAFRMRYPFVMPARSDAAVLLSAHPEVIATLMALAGRALDGGALYLHLAGGGRASEGVAAGGDAATLDAAGLDFVAWFDALIAQPDPAEPQSWNPSRLEHQFDVMAGGAAGAKTLNAAEYHGAALDWHAFDVDPRAAPVRPSDASSPEKVITSKTLPASVAFEGMPQPRWWAFEDSRVNLSDVRPEPTDIGGVLLLEFLLVFSNDWSISPLTVPTNTLVSVEGLLVENVFGERLWIEPAAHGDDDDRRRWAMFGLSMKGDHAEPADQRLLVFDTATTLTGEAIEQVALVRDEMANLVWGVERTIQSPNGGPKSGAEAGQEVRAALASPTPPAAAPPNASAQYRLETTAPEHWIPFLPVRIGDSNRAIQLQRGATRRIIDDVERGFVRPRTSLLRVGLDQTTPTSYFVHEEEAPRAGALITLRYKRARGADGRPYVWLTSSKGVGRGGASSGLAFDVLAERKARTE